MVKIYKKSILFLICVCLLASASLTGQNLLTNGGFETGVLAPWTAGNNNVATVDADAYEGAWAGRGNLEQLVTLTQGTNYTFSAYVKCLAGCDQNMWLGMRDIDRTDPAQNFRFSDFSDYSLATFDFTATQPGVYKMWIFGVGDVTDYIGDNFLLLEEGTTSIDEVENSKIEITNSYEGVKVSIEESINEAVIDIVNLSGQLIYRKKASNGDTFLNNAEFKAAGIYVVSVRTSKTIKSSKVAIVSN